MRLIDADELKEYIRKWGIGNVINDEQSEILDAINAQPTAYDVNKVVEQLQKECDESYTNFEKYAKEHGLKLDDEYHYLGLQRAIEIVKAGGIDG